jgi:hypothetical protein
MARQNEDPLDELVMKSEEVEGEYRKLLADLLRPHVRIDPDTGKVYFVPHPPKLNTKQHVLVYLLAKLALAQKNDNLEPVASAKDVEDATGLPGGTVRPKLTELFRERVISRSEAGYFVEAANLHKARSILEDTLSAGDGAPSR